MRINDVKAIARARYLERIDKKALIFLSAVLGWTIIVALVTYILVGVFQPVDRTYELAGMQDLVISGETVTLNGYVLEQTNPVVDNPATRAVSMGWMILLIGPLVAWLIWIFSHLYRLQSYVSDFTQKWAENDQELVEED